MLVQSTLTVPDLVKVAVLMPTTRAEESNKGPPEFPELMAASVCIATVYQASENQAAEHINDGSCDLTMHHYLYCAICFCSNR